MTIKSGEFEYALRVGEGITTEWRELIRTGELKHVMLHYVEPGKNRIKGEFLHIGLSEEISR